MKRCKKKTADDVIAHFQRRCRERIGEILNQKELKQLMNEHKLELLGRQSNTRTMFVLRKEMYKTKPLSKDVVLAYDKPRHAFVTVIPYDAWKSNHDEYGQRTDIYVDPDDPPIWA